VINNKSDNIFFIIINWDNNIKKKILLFRTILNKLYIFAVI